nr:GLPGLI family protein [uncultured Carboxylicivirga sp.]
MDRYSFLTLMLIIASVQITLAQTYQTLDKVKYVCHYNYEFVLDSTNRSKTKTTDMVLLIGAKYSQFAHSSLPDKDSLLLVYKNEDPESAAMKILPQLMGNPPTFFTSFNIIKSSENNSCNLYEKVTSTYLKISMPTALKWQLTANTDTLLAGTKAQVATTQYAGRTFKAWYTTEVPVSDGPYIFGGLPGLILKLEDTQRQHCFELTSFEPISYNKPILLEDKNYINTNIQGYQKAKKGDIEERIQRYANPEVLQLNDDEKAKLNAKLRSRNNYIERL